MTVTALMKLMGALFAIISSVRLGKNTKAPFQALGRCFCISFKNSVDKLGGVLVF